MHWLKPNCCCTKSKNQKVNAISKAKLMIYSENVDTLNHTVDALTKRQITDVDWGRNE